VVDDNSPDGTGSVADQLAAQAPGTLEVMHRTEKRGLGRAYVAGMTRAVDEGADIVIQMDADLSHPVSVIPVMLDVLASSDAAVVIGSRYIAGGSTAADWPWYRKALSVSANLYVNAILRLHVRDATAGFRAYRSSTLAAIDLRLIVSARTWEDVLYREELERAARRESVDVRFTLTRAVPAGWSGFDRRIDAAMLTDVGPDPSAGPAVFVCGPTPFVERAADLLVALGHPPQAIRAERFGPSGS